MDSNVVEVWATVHGRRYKLEFHLDVLEPLAFPWNFDFGDGFRHWHPTLETCLSHIVQLQASGDYGRVSPLITEQQKIDWYDEAFSSGLANRIW